MTTDTVTPGTGQEHPQPIAVTLTTVTPAVEDSPDHGHAAHGHGPDEPTLTLREASDATGASVSAMRKAIRAGRLPSTVVEGPNGPEHRVTVSAVRAAMPKATASPVIVVKGGVTTDRVGSVEDLARVLEQVVSYSHEAGERAARAEAQRDHFRHELARVRLELSQVRQELKALPAAPADTVTEPSTPSRDPVLPEGVVMVRRRWWHRRGSDRG